MNSWQVPLIMYQGGRAVEIGRTVVHEDGRIEAVVAQDHWIYTKHIFEEGTGEFTISKIYPQRTFPLRSE